MNKTCFSQAGNVVTGEMVEELILAGADIIKVGIGPGDHSVTLRVPFCIDQNHSLSLYNHKRLFRDELKQISELLRAISCPCVLLYRLCLYHPQEDRRGVPPAQRCDWVRRCGSWPGRPHHLCGCLSSLMMWSFIRSPDYHSLTAGCFVSSPVFSVTQDGGCTCPGDVSKAFGKFQFFIFSLLLLIPDVAAFLFYFFFPQCVTQVLEQTL